MASKIKRRGRPRKRNVVDIVLHLHLERGVDDDIIRLLNVPKGKRARTAIIAWRAGGIPSAQVALPQPVDVSRLVNSMLS